MKPYLRILQALSLLTQLGITLVVPPLLLCWLALHLQENYGWGLWTTPVAIVIGLLTALCGVWRVVRGVVRQNEKEDDDPPVSFDQHL